VEDATNDAEALRAIATRALAECCDGCRKVLRSQLVQEELEAGPR
jgi:hypothetical protein